MTVPIGERSWTTLTYETERTKNLRTQYAGLVVGRINQLIEPAILGRNATEGEFEMPGVGGSVIKGTILLNPGMYPVGMSFEASLGNDPLVSSSTYIIIEGGVHHTATTQVVHGVDARVSVYRRDGAIRDVCLTRRSSNGNWVRGTPLSPATQTIFNDALRGIGFTEEEIPLII